MQMERVYEKQEKEIEWQKSLNVRNELLSGASAPQRMRRAVVLRRAAPCCVACCVGQLQGDQTCPLIHGLILWRRLRWLCSERPEDDGGGDRARPFFDGRGQVWTRAHSGHDRKHTRCTRLHAHQLLRTSHLFRPSFPTSHSCFPPLFPASSPPLPLLSSLQLLPHVVTVCNSGWFENR